MVKKTENHESLLTRFVNLLAHQPWFSRYKPGLRAMLYAATFLFALFSIIVLFKIVMVLFSTTEIDKNQLQKTSDTVSPETQSTTTQQTESTQNSTKTPSAKYQVIYGEADMRGDEGLYLFVLTDPVDLVKDDFQGQIEAIVRSIVKSYGSKITIDIFDNMEALDIQYQVWALKTINEPLEKKQEALVVRHQIASFEGSTVLGPSKNTIILFPNATNKTSEVSDLSRTYEFNP